MKNQTTWVRISGVLVNLLFGEWQIFWEEALIYSVCLFPQWKFFSCGQNKTTECRLGRDCAKLAPTSQEEPPPAHPTMSQVDDLGQVT